MRHIILAGEFNSITQNLYQLLGNDYFIQLGSADADCLKGILRMARVQLILMVVTGLEAEHETLFQVIEEVRPDLPIICIGTEGEIGLFGEHMERKEVSVLYRPVQMKTIKERIGKALGIIPEDAKRIEGNWVKRFGKRTIRKIMLVDDSQIQLRALNNLLQRDYEICMAESGKEALRLLPQFEPDLIFLDYHMPGVDGRETLQTVRDEGYEDIPVVFLTGVKDRKRIQSVLELNPAGYLLKPVEQNRLYEILEELSADGDTIDEGLS